MILRALRPCAPAVLIACLVTACAGRVAEDDDGQGWDPLLPLRPAAVLSAPSLAPGLGGSRLTVPRITGAPATITALEEEADSVWPERAPPRIPITDPEAVARPAGATLSRRNATAPTVEADPYDASPFDPAMLGQRRQPSR